MKLKFLWGIAIVSLLALVLCNACNNESQNSAAYKEASVREYFRAQTDSLLQYLDLLVADADSGQDVLRLKQDFAASRFQYKKIEPIAEYYFQGLIQRINGPALPDVSIQDGQVWPPHGFQVLEQILFENYRDSSKIRLGNEVRLLQTDLRFIRSSLADLPILPHHMHELIRHEFIRIATLGITGFDASLSKLSMQEAAYSLKGIMELLHASGFKIGSELWRRSENAIRYIEYNASFDDFNRIGFLTEFLEPFSDEFENSVPDMQRLDTALRRPFNGSLHQLMRGERFNPDYYSGYATLNINRAKVDLGRLLFSDVRLSGSGNISCASCHKPELFFTDGQEKASDFVHGGTLPRNTPTLYYSGLQSSQFYDLRAASLEDQADFVMSSHNEFNNSSAAIARQLWADSVYRKMFREAFPTKDSISGYEVRNSIAAFVRSLSSFTSPFDSYMRGNKSAMNDEQLKGFNLFTGKAKCATCHFIPLFNGTIPPWYDRTESEIIGVPSGAVFKDAIIDKDSGRYVIHRFPEFLHAFKTPGLRNVAKTAPYMHKGVYRTLDEVLEFYQKGGGAGIGINLPSQTLPFDSLQLNEAEKKAIIAFLESITDRHQELNVAPTSGHPEKGKIPHVK